MGIFDTIIYQPIFNLLIWFYNTIPGNDIGLAIIVMTAFVKLILYPFSKAQIAQQRAMQELQPKIEEVRTRLKDNQEAQAKELMELYKREKVNPASSCLPLLIQLPIFIGLLHALREGLAGHSLNTLYPFIQNPGTINPMFLGFINLSKPNYVLAVLAGAVQFVQSWMMMKRPSLISKAPPEVEGTPAAKDEDMAAMMNKQMMYIMPVVTVFIGISLPGGLALYWLVMSLLTVLQQWIQLRTPRAPKPTAQLS
jgi:YidC/Oxa1 family membrane protein insertase